MGASASYDRLWDWQCPQCPKNPSGRGYRNAGDAPRCKRCGAARPQQGPSNVRSRPRSTMPRHSKQDLTFFCEQAEQRAVSNERADQLAAAKAQGLAKRLAFSKAQAERRAAADRLAVAKER